jgi:hypothetical protein
MSNESMEQTPEVERLKYKGNTIPFFIKFVWVSIIIYTFAYFALYAWPDLMLWLKK